MTNTDTTTTAIPAHATAFDGKLENKFAHLINEVIKASGSNSIIMAQKPAKQPGLAVGISSGANMIGALQCKTGCQKTPFR